MNKYTVIILAAGSGKRMGVGKNKLLIELDGVPLLVYTLNVFEKDHLCERIILVVNEDERDLAERLIKEYNIHKVSDVVPGGKERQDSVFQGLTCIYEDGIVLIHDGARPFIKKEYIHQVMKQAITNGGAVLGVPVKDTIKMAQNQQVIQTLNRDLLWSIQTPQAFHYDIIYRAHLKAQSENFLGTDDAAIVERLGEKVVIVHGDYENIKITTPEDLYFAKAILNKRQKE